MSQIARTRIRRYKPHGSALWVVCLHQPDELNRPDFITRRVKFMCENLANPIAGFAIVVWDDDESSSCDWDIWHPRIPNVLVPAFVGERVKLEITEDSTIRRMQDEGLI
jgi:hypothetical protein